MDKIAVIDFGGQYAHLIANRIRRLKVFCEVFGTNADAEKLKSYKGIILSGGPQSVYSEFAPAIDREIFTLKKPILGICYGHQFMAFSLGGTVGPATVKEYGSAKLTVQNPIGVLKGLKESEIVWMSHGDEVTALPPGFEPMAHTENCQFAAFQDSKRKLYSIQFHAEVTHTAAGMKIFENFLNICKVKREWGINRFLREIKQKIKTQVDKRKIFMMVSGGVDSTVAFMLLKRIFGAKRIFGLFVDTGFLRLNEQENVMKTFKNLGAKNVICYDASKEFFSALSYVTDPEEKRRIIGNLFIKIQKKVVKKLGLDETRWMLGQGTIYPDTIETGGTKHAAKIKTHHNRVKIIVDMLEKGLVIEPLKDLYKDEVRWLGEKLNIPKEIIWRHPFPGPGLAVRCLCAAKSSYPKNKQSLEKKINKLLALYGFTGKILPIKSVGVQGDDRTYKHPVVIIGRGTWRILEEISTKITNKFNEINRVVYAVNSESIQKITITPTYLTPKTISILKAADAIVNDFIKKNLMIFDIWQFPVVLVPVSINSFSNASAKTVDSTVNYSIVVRPVCSEEAMTASFYKMDFDMLDQLAHNILKTDGINAVLYDITNKPPGTIEWE